MTIATTSRPRSTLLAAAACVCGGAALGAANGLCDAWSAIGEQRYRELGFAHTLFEDLRAGGEAGVAVGARWGLGFALVVVALAIATAPFPGLGIRPSKLTKLVASRTGLAGLIAAVALASNAALALVEREQEWLGAADVAHAFAFTLVCAAVLACISRAARDAVEDAAKERAIAAALAGFAALAVPAFWIHRSSLSHPFDVEPWITLAPFVALAALIYVAVRRAWRGLAKSAVFAAGFALAVPYALRPIESAFGAPSLHAKLPQNVVFIGIDTLRADATSLYGASLHGRDTTPNLRKLAQRGLVFDNATSQAPWTLPSFASMFTGKYPHEHGAYSLSGRLRPGEVTLAEVLREAGYATSAAVAHTYLDTYHGLNQGFERFDESNALGHRAITAPAITDLTLGAIEAANARPFFAFAHYFDPHYEYMDHAESDWSDGYTGWLAAQLDYDNLERNRHLIEKPELEFLVDRYEEEIAFTDREIGRLVDGLAARKLLESTWIVVVADHGEEFLERGAFGHTTGMWQEQIHVPLVIVPPLSGLSAVRALRVVETRDLFGTVLTALDVDFGASARERDLLAGDSTRVHERKAFSIVWLPDAKPEWGKRFQLSALRDGRWKFVRDFTRDRSALFDLGADPKELRDVSAEHSDVATSMRATLETWTQEQQNRGGNAERRPIDKDLERKLKELGYL